MRSKTPALAAIGLMLVSGCSTPQYMPQTPIPTQKPTACLVSCPRLPPLETTHESGAVMWVHEVIDLAGECKRLHDECRETK